MENKVLAFGAHQPQNSLSSARQLKNVVVVLTTLICWHRGFAVASIAGSRSGGKSTNRNNTEIVNLFAPAALERQSSQKERWRCSKSFCERAGGYELRGIKTIAKLTTLGSLPAKAFAALRLPGTRKYPINLWNRGEDTVDARGEGARNGLRAVNALASTHAGSLLMLTY